jgi:hypothetical protein
MEEEEAQITTITGTSVCRAFTTGYRFTLQDHYRQDMNHKPYVLIQIQHEAYQGADYPGVASEGGGEEFSYSNSFECIPHEVSYRPRQRAEKPRVHGTQTAVVVGPSGEEIYTDDLGRIKVQFHWDREGKRTRKPVLIRVRQVGGPQWARKTPAHRPGSDRRFSKVIRIGLWHRLRLSQGAHAALNLPGENPKHHQVRFDHWRGRVQRDSLRGQKGPGGNLHPRSADMKQEVSMIR